MPSRKSKMIQSPSVSGATDGVRPMCLGFPNGVCNKGLCNTGYRWGSFKGHIDIDVEVDVDIDCYFAVYRGFSKSVQVLLNGIEAVMELTLISMKSRTLCIFVVSMEPCLLKR